MVGNGFYYSSSVSSEKIKVVHCTEDTNRFIPANSNGLKKNKGFNRR